MLGWLSEPASRDSRRKRWVNDGSAWRNALSSLSATEPVEVGLAREVDGRHAAAAELLEDLVAADCPRHLGAHQWNVRWPALGSTTALNRVIGVHC